MAFGELKLQIPGGSPPIAPLVLRDFNGDFGWPRRSRVGFASVLGVSNWGTAAIDGPSYDYRYAWSCAFNLPPADRRHLKALANWQDRTYKSGADGKLQLTDELHELDPEPSPHSKAILSGTSQSWAGGSGYVYGYGVFDVKLEPGEDFEQRINWLGSEVLSFRLVEL